MDIGRRIEPNLAVLAGIDPDLIVMSSFYDELARQLSPIAPVVTLDIYQPHATARWKWRPAWRSVSGGRRPWIG